MFLLISRYLIRPLALRDVSQIDMSVRFRLKNTVFDFVSPLGIAPTAFHRMADPRGELATVKGVFKADNQNKKIKNI